MSLFGIIFDTPSIDSLKESLVRFLEDKSLIYVYHPNYRTVPKDYSESLISLVSYKEPNNFNIESAFKSTVSIIGKSNESDKYIVLITDRFQSVNNPKYRNGFLTNVIRGFNSKIVVFGMVNCDRLTLKSISEDNDAQYFDLDDPNKIENYLKGLC